MHMHHELTDSVCASTALRKASRAISRAYDDALSPLSMTTSQFSILRALERSGDSGIPLSRLADAMVMERTSLYRALDPIAKTGWISIEGSGRGRPKVAVLTEAGKNALSLGEARWMSVQDRMLAAYGPKRWAVAVGVLSELAELGLALQR